ncbi:MAG: hypothetical protein JWQ27_76 [Ferruginibacter sp.]|nr:hypothetical protein [Ferruginibacter sp.]
MKKIILTLLLTPVSYFLFAQFVAKAEIKGKVEGICDQKNVYALFEMFADQKQAVCAITAPEIEKMLNDSVLFLKDNRGYTDKGMVSLIINCKGELVKCEIDNKTKTPLLDEQIVHVLKTLTSWKAGKLKGKSVDSLRLWSFDIADGKISLK